MAYVVKVTDAAQRQLDALPERVLKRVARWIELLTENPRRQPSRKLEGYPDLRRIHASKDYVIVYSIIEREVIVLVVRVAYRREVYRRL